MGINHPACSKLAEDDLTLLQEAARISGLSAGGQSSHHHCIYSFGLIYGTVLMNSRNKMYVNAGREWIYHNFRSNCTSSQCGLHPGGAGRQATGNGISACIGGWSESMVCRQHDPSVHADCMHASPRTSPHAQPDTLTCQHSECLQRTIALALPLTLWLCSFTGLNIC